MKMLCLSGNGDLVSLAKRVQEQEHEVKTFVLSNLAQAAGHGIVDRVVSWRPEMQWADLIVADYQPTPAECAALRDWGRLTFGIDAPSWDSAPALADSVEYKYLVFWNGRKFIEPGFVVFDEGALLAGNIGPILGSPLAAAVYPTAKRPDLSDFDKELKHSNYRGPIVFSFNANSTEQMVTHVEARTEMMYLAPIFQMAKKPEIDILAEVAGGTTDEIPVANAVGVSVRLYAPPWPYRMPTGVYVEGAPKINPKAEPYLWMIDVWKNLLTEELPDSPLFGASGSFALAVGIGRRGKKDIFREAQRRAVRVISGVQHPALQYRIDACASARPRYEQLTTWGLI